jgi:putative restriction endonuclease
MSTGMTWTDAVSAAIRRIVSDQAGVELSQQDLIDQELGNIVSDVGSDGATPEQTLSRVLQELRDEGKIEFLDDNGYYRSK